MEYSKKAVVLDGFGSYDRLKIQKFPLPPLEGKVEVHTECCGVNFSDLYTRQGMMPHHKLPMVLGMESVGVVKALGCANHSLKVGQRVICFDYHNCGLFQDIVRISPDKCYPLPDDITVEQGASIFINYLTAYFALFDLGGLKPNSTILILSCAGGVGCAATQLAKTVEGVTIVGTASKGKEAAVEANGVNHVLSHDELEKKIKDVCPDGFDLILDNQSGDTFKFLQSKLKPLGKIILIGANTLMQNDKKLSSFNMLKFWWKTKNVVPTELVMNNRCVAGLHLGVLSEKEPEKVLKALNLMFTLLREGKIAPIIHRVFPLEEIVSASKALGERTNVGKVLLNVQEDTIIT